jgi:RNA polymerase sigma-70 factor (ECF subfamily)
MDAPGEITELLIQLRGGRTEVRDRLISSVYAELHRLAAKFVSRESPENSIQPTDLVHRAYLRLIDQREQNWKNRAHFFGIAAHLMRLILVDEARRRRSQRHGGAVQRISLERATVLSEENYDELLALDQALERLQASDPRLVRVVELRFFAELSVEETAEVLGVSEKTVKRDWQFARLWLYGELSRSAHSEA